MREMAAFIRQRGRESMRRRTKQVLQKLLERLWLLFPEMMTVLLKAALLAYNAKGKDFIRVIRREKLLPSGTLLPMGMPGDKAAIVLQGPIDLRGDFTLRTVQLYQALYPKVPIIVSTWEDANPDAVKALEGMGARVILGELPACRGAANINYQLLSSLAGIKKAKELGADYVWKTRTDQRYCRAGFLDSMLAWSKCFPVLPLLPSIRQNSRMIVLTGSLFIPFHVCDYMYFAQVDDALRFFSQPPDSRHHVAREGRILRDWVLDTFPEALLFEHYLESFGMEKKDFRKVAFYWHYVKGYMLFLSREEGGLLWDKYEEEQMLQSMTNLPYASLSTQFDFSLWLKLYRGELEYRPEYEEYCTGMEITRRF